MTRDVPVSRSSSLSLARAEAFLANLQALEETIAVLSECDAVARLTASETELAAGRGETEADLVAAMTA